MATGLLGQSERAGQALVINLTFPFLLLFLSLSLLSYSSLLLPPACYFCLFVAFFNLFLNSSSSSGELFISSYPQNFLEDLFVVMVPFFPSSFPLSTMCLCLIS